MSKKNPEYDFAWCPGCGDFGVRRAVEFALTDRLKETEEIIENTVVVAGIGCSGNLVHLLEDPQPFGLHGIHGRSLPIAFGVKMANPDLNVITVAGDGDFLSIGMEHIAPQATRNLDICSVVMDNGVYGLTKGQSSPTTDYGVKTTSTPYGKIEDKIHPLNYYLTIGASFIASGYSSKPRDLAKLIQAGMEHPGFAVVHVQSPCTTYNDTYEILKGNAKKGVPGLMYDIPEEYDRTDRLAAEELINSPGIPVGIIYEDKTRPSLTAETNRITESVKSRDVAQLLSDYDF